MNGNAQVTIRRTREEILTGDVIFEGSELLALDLNDPDQLEQLLDLMESEESGDVVDESYSATMEFEGDGAKLEWQQGHPWQICDAQGNVAMRQPDSPQQAPINSYADLDAALDGLTPEEMRGCLYEVFLSLYGRANNDEWRIDPNKAWDSDTAENVRYDLQNVGLTIGTADIAGDVCDTCGRTGVEIDHVEAGNTVCVDCAESGE